MAVDGLQAGGLLVSEQVRRALDSLSAGERKVGRALLANYPIAGLETVAELARRASVSSPTVIRFVGRLGFTGYPDFQKTRSRSTGTSGIPTGAVRASGSSLRRRRTGPRDRGVHLRHQCNDG